MAEIVLKAGGKNKKLAEQLATMNGGRLDERDGVFVVTAPRISANRAEVEGIVGQLRDVQWLSIFMNRKGTVRELNNYSVVIGEETDVVEKLQPINIRVPKEKKDEIQKFAEKLGISMNDFIIGACDEFIDFLRGQELVEEEL